MSRGELGRLVERYGGLAGFLGGLTGLVAATIYALGFTLGIPADAFAQLHARVVALEINQAGIVGLQRYFCYRDPDAAPLFIPCDRLNGNKVPGQ